MINFIVCGLEGTLIDENNKTISEETIDLIATLLENDFKFAVATGLNYNLCLLYTSYILQHHLFTRLFKKEEKVNICMMTRHWKNTERLTKVLHFNVTKV